MLREHHRREDLEVKVLALEKERQQMEAEGQSMAVALIGKKVWLGIFLCCYLVL